MRDALISEHTTSETLVYTMKKGQAPVLDTENSSSSVTPAEIDWTNPWSRSIAVEYLACKNTQKRNNSKMRLIIEQQYKDYAIDYFAIICYCIYKYSSVTKVVTIVHYEKDKSY